VSAFAELPTLPLQQIWDGVAGRAVHGEHVTLAVVELDADSVVPEHSHENEQLGMIIAGSLTFRVGDETRELSIGCSWRIPANVPHEVRTGPGGAVAVEAFAPPRDDWNAFERLAGRRPRWP